MRGPGRITNRNATSRRPQQREVRGGKKAGGKRVAHHALGAGQVMNASKKLTHACWVLSLQPVLNGWGIMWRGQLVSPWMRDFKDADR